MSYLRLLPHITLLAGTNYMPDDPEAAARIATTQGNTSLLIARRHPDYEKKFKSWDKFRSAWVGGAEFVEKYTSTFSKREDAEDFKARKAASYCPAISKGSVIRIKNAIFQRIGEVTRKGGPKSYRDACNGDKWGVDKLGSSMNTFIGKEVLPELLAIEKVGVFIDAPELPPNFSMMDKVGKRPYIYTYKAEDILAWVPDDSSEPNQFDTLLLREHYLKLDKDNGLPVAWECRYRYMRKVLMSGGGFQVLVQFYNEAGKQTDKNGSVESGKDYYINLPLIPFVVFELSQSLLTDVADYQIALLNLGSSDMAYALKMNFPFYVEQYDPRSEAGPFKTGIVPDTKVRDGVIPRNSQQTPAADTAKEEILVGVAKGRRYPIGAERPGFVHPSSEPLVASMKKQEQLKQEIVEILNLTLSNVTAGSIDLESQDRRQGLESGLNNIGMELEHGERRIAAIWALYEDSTEPITVTYPNTYSIKSDAERRAEAKEINELRSGIPSTIYQKENAKQVVLTMLQGKIPQAKLEEAFSEIDSAKTMTSNAEEIKTDLENGLVSTETASVARGYPAGEVAQAKIDHAERIARIQAAQTSEDALKNAGARGVPDAAAAPGGGPLEKKVAGSKDGGVPDSTKVRGEGK
jgi:hypothetical protein